MALRTWFTRFIARLKGSAANTVVFPFPVFWRSVCSLKQPVIVVCDGLDIVAASEEVHEIFGSQTVGDIQRILQDGLDSQTSNRLLAAMSNPVSVSTEIPVRIQNQGVYVNVIVTITTLPEYPAAHAALLLLRDNRNPTVPQWAQTSRELLSRIPYPAWVLDPNDTIVFSNGPYSEFPMEALKKEAVAAANRNSPADLEQILALFSDFVMTPDKVRSTLSFYDHDYNLGTFGQWRITHFPLKNSGGERMVGVLARPMRSLSAKALTMAEDELEIGLMGHEALTQVLQVREAERTALAREVHDSLGQELSVLKLEMRRLSSLVYGTAASTPGVTEHLASVRQLVDNIAKSARRIAYEMRQDLATVKGLSHAAQGLVLDLRERIGLQIQLELMPGWVEPEQGMAHNMFRSLQEMLNNVSKHAKATRCLVRMGLSGTTYWLEVRDDGIGMPAGVEQTSIGLRSLNERAALYNGHVTIQSRPVVEGTMVRVELPERRVQTAPIKQALVRAELN